MRSWSDNIAGPTTSPITPIDLSIYEIPGELIVKVKAIDSDSDNNGKIFYSLKIPLGFPRLFEIDRDVGEVKVSQTLSRGDIGFYRVHIIASDNGSPPLSDIKVLSINLVDQPPGFGRGRTDDSTSSKNWKRFGTTNNIVIVAILSIISAILVVILITAISCMLSPCRFHSQRFSRNYMSQEYMYPQNKSYVISKDLELSYNNEKDYGEFCPSLPNDKENNTMMVPSHMNDQFNRRFPSNTSLEKSHFQTWISDNTFNRNLLGTNVCCLHNSALSPFILRQSYLQTNPYETHLLTLNDEQHSDSGRGGSDEDLSIGMFKLTNNNRKSNNFGLNVSSLNHPLKKVQCYPPGDSLSIVGEECESRQTVEEIAGNNPFSEKENYEIKNVFERRNDQLSKNL